MVGREMHRPEEERTGDVVGARARGWDTENASLERDPRLFAFPSPPPERLEDPRFLS